MNRLSRRGLLSLALPTPPSLFMGGSLASLLINPAPAAEPYAGDPKIISKWMQQWMGGSKSTTGPLRMQRFADPIYVLIDPIEWHPSRPEDQKYKPVIVPKYFVTDLASVPRFFWDWLRPDGLYAYAAVIHDYLYWTQVQSRESANEILEIVMEEYAVPALQRYAIYGAVSLFGMSSWDEDRKLKESGEHRVLKALPDSPTMTWQQYKKMPGVFSAE